MWPTAEELFGLDISLYDHCAKSVTLELIWLGMAWFLFPTGVQGQNFVIYIYLFIFLPSSHREWTNRKKGRICT
jgi:hypothetical protein